MGDFWQKNFKIFNLVLASLITFSVFLYFFINLKIMYLEFEKKTLKGSVFNEKNNVNLSSNHYYTGLKTIYSETTQFMKLVDNIVYIKKQAGGKVSYEINKTLP